MTNCIGKEISDPWFIKGISRKKVKGSATPSLYGSSKDSAALWSQDDIKHTAKEAASMDYELKSGVFSVANAFKDMLIENVQPTQTMHIDTHNDSFTIECNKFRNVGEYTRRYPIYSTEENTVLAIAHTHTKRVPDLKQFTRYFPTLLIHNGDSSIANKICLNKSIQWIISIHDAFLVSAVNAHIVRQLYSTHIEKFHTNRETILNKFFKSINLNPAAIKEWEYLKTLIEPVEGKFKCNAMALK